MKNKEKNNPKGAYFLYRILFSLIALCHCIPASSSSLKEQISLPTNNSVNTVGKVLSYIEKNSDYIFIYQDAKIDLDRKVAAPQTSQSVNEILDTIFAGTDIRYTIKNRQIAIYRNKSKKEETSSHPIVAQETKSVTGTVKDQMNEPIPGVNVIVKGTTIGTTTDINGYYSLNDVPQTSNTLVFSFVGMASQEVTIGRQAVINVIMQEDAVTLEDVVAIGYGSQKKESLTSAITSVNTELLENRSVPKVATALQGITPGVNIRQSAGRPGFSTQTFDIRGSSYGTFSKNPPLVLIDGVVGEIDNVSSDDIDKISILKDAAAAAIYGSRATGGVVLITTKKGSSGAPTVNYSGIVGVQKIPFGNYKFINSAEWMRANNEAARLDGSPDIFTTDQIKQYENSADPNYPSESQWTDWIKKSALQHTHNLSISGGNEKLNFYTSGSYVSQEGFIDNDDYEKWNFLVNLNYTPFSRLEINTSIAYQRENITRPIGNDVFTYVRNALLNPPIDPFYLSNGDYNNKATLGANPKYLTKEGGNGLYDFDNLRMSVGAKFKVIEGLFLKYTIATSMNFNSNNTQYKKIPFKDNNGEIYGYNRSEVYVSEEWDRSTYVNNLVMLDYTKKFGDDHNFYLMGGFQSESNRYDAISASANKFPNNEIREIKGSTGSGSDIKGSSEATDWSIASLIGRLSYSFREKYLFEGTFRYDGSSRFSPKQRWGFFPSVSASWRMKEEGFMQNIDFLSNLKLRVSWGQLGNQGEELYPFATQISVSDKYAFGNGLTSVASIGDPVNLNLSWEKKTTTNLGLDFGFFNNRLYGSFDYFFDRTDGIIGRPAIPTTFGAKAPIQNTYTIDNRGYEIEINWRDNIGDFRYHIGANLSDSRDKIVSLGGIGTIDPKFGSGLVQKSGSTYNAEGHARNSLYLYRTNGLFVNQAEIDNHAYISPLTRPGDIVFIDTDGNGKLTSDDKEPDNRTTTPHYIFGINLGAEYKNFDISVVLNGVGQRWAYRNNGGHYLSGVRASLSILESNYKDRWTEANPDKWADQTRLTQNNWIANEYSTITSGPCEYHLRNFAYLRVKNIQLGYTIPKEISQKASISRLRCYLTAENLFTWKPGYREPIDPEASENYTEDGSTFFGPAKVISFGLSVTF